MVFWSLVESIGVIEYMKDILLTVKKYGIPCVIVPCRNLFAEKNSYLASLDNILTYSH